MKKVYLKGIDKEIYQDENSFSINIDTELLGNYLDFYPNKTVLDIGTNTGSLLIYANRLKPKQLVGIDIDDKALALASKNMTLNNIEADLINIDVNDYKSEQFDIIICNPPYFKYDSDTNNNAKDDKYLPLDSLFNNYRRLIKDNGLVYMIYPANRLVEVIDSCHKHKFKIVDLKLVYNEDSDAIRVLFKLKRGIIKDIRISKPIIIKH